MGGASPEHQGSPWVCANCGAGATTQHFSTACFGSTSQFLLELLFLADLDDGQSPGVLNSFLCKLLLVTVLSQQQNPSQGRLHCVAETDLELLAPSQSPASASRVARLQIHMTVPLCGYSLKRHTIEIELELAYIMK